MSDYKITVGTELTGAEKLDAFEKKLNSLKTETINVDVKLTVDSKNIASDVTKQLNRQLGKALNIGSGSSKMRITPDIDIDSGDIAKSANRALKDLQNSVHVSMDIGNTSQYMDNIKEIEKQIEYINRLSINPDANMSRLKEASKYLDTLLLRKAKAEQDEILDLGDLDIDSARRLAVELEKVAYNVADVKAKMDDIGVADALKQEASEIQATFNKLRNTYKEIGRVENDMIKLDPDSAGFATATQRLKELAAEAQRLDGILGSNMSDGMVEALIADLEKAGYTAEQAKNKILDMQRAAANKISQNFDNKDYFAQVKTVENGVASLERKNHTLMNSLMNTKKAYDELENSAEAYRKTQSPENMQALVAAQERFNSSLNETNNLLKVNKDYNAKVKQVQKNKIASDKLNDSKAVLDRQMEAWLTKNSAAAAEFGDRIRDIQLRLKSCDATGFGHLKSEFQQVKLEAEIAGKATMTFGDRLKQQVKQYAAYVGVAGVMAAGAQAFRVMARNVLEVDTAMTGLYRVTDLTAEGYDQLYSNMISSAKEYGATLTDTINATSDWVRAGFDANTALGLADVTAMYQHVSDLDYAEASKNLLTAYNGFKDSFNEDFGEGNAIAAVEHIADSFNELDNQFSITSAGLGEGLARSASALQMAGNTFEEAAALVGATAEVQQDPEKAGNAMKVLSLRLRGMKGALEDLGEESEGIENISKMQGQILKITEGKVNIFDDNGDFRSTYDIMKDIAEVYDELSSTDQANLLETIAGKNRANDIAALIGNFDQAIAMAETAEHSTGSAREENEKYLDSLQGRLDVMQASLQNFSGVVLDDGFLKGGVSAITALVDAAAGLIDMFGLIPVVLGSVSAGFSVFGKSLLHIDKANKSVKLFGKELSGIGTALKGMLPGKSGKLNSALSLFDSDFDKMKRRIDADKEAIEQYKKVLMMDNVAPEMLNNAYNRLSDDAKLYVEGLNAASISSDKFEQDIQEQTAKLNVNSTSLRAQISLLKEYNSAARNADGKSSNLKKTTGDIADDIKDTNIGGTAIGALIGQAGGKAIGGKAIGAILKSGVKMIGSKLVGLLGNFVLPMVGGFIASLAFDWLFNGISDALNQAENTANRVGDMMGKFNDSAASLRNAKKTIDDVGSSYEKLAKGVDVYNNKNVSLSTDEYEEYLNIVNQIADQFPQLVTGYDAQGNAILSCKGNVDALTESYKALKIEENKKLLEGDGEDYKGIEDISKDLKNDFDNAQIKQKNLAEHLDSVFKSGSISKNSILKNIGTDTYDVAKDVAKELEAANKTIEGVELPKINASKEEAAEYLAEVYEQYPDILRGVINKTNSEMDAMTQEMRTAMNAHMENAFLGGTYENIDEEMQGIVSRIVSGIDSGLIIDKNASGGSDAVLEYIDGIMGAINDMAPEAQDKLKSAFDLQGKFSSEDMNFGEYKKQIEDVAKIINSLDVAPDVKQALKDSLNADGIIEQYDGVIKSLGELGVEGAEEFANGLNSSELAVYYDVVAEIGDDSVTADELKKKLEHQASIADALEFEINIESEINGIEAVNTAMKESVSATGMATESIDALKSRYADLDSYDPAKVFNKTSQGIRANRDEINKLEQELAKTKLDGAQKSINDLKSAYENVTERIRTCNNAAERQALLAEQSSYADKISELEEMQAQYEGLTSAYNNWVNAQAGGEEGDIYDDVMSKLESAAELRKKGLVGTNEFAAAVEFMSGKDTSSMSANDIAAAYDEALPKMQRYFQEGSDGIANMLSDISALNSEWVHLNDNGEWEIDMSAEDMKKAAEQLGISVEAIEAAFGKGTDYGLEIDYDSVYEASESLEDMRTNAQKANDSLKELGKTDLTFSFESDDIEDLDAQIENATKMAEQFKNTDGTWNMEIEGAEEAQQIISTLILQRQEVSKPEFMKISVATIGDENLGRVISAMQQIQTYKNLYEIQVAIGADTSDTKAKISEVIGQLQTLKTENPDIFADLNLDTSEFDSALSTLSGNVTAGVQLDAGALATVQSALSGVDAKVLANVGLGDTSAVDNYTATEKTAKGKVNWDNNTSLVDTYAAQTKTATGTVNWGNNTTNVKQSFTATGTINWTNTNPTGGGKSGGKSPVDGTAHVNGTAFADGSNHKRFKRGNWGLEDSGTALMGELGQETIVRDGHFFTVGDNGAEFVKYRKGDIIFNHKILFCGVA